VPADRTGRASPGPVVDVRSHQTSHRRGDRGTIVVQGWKLLDAEARSAMDIPDHEDAVEVPLAVPARAVR
jgi:hypothetical protein